MVPGLIDVLENKAGKRFTGEVRKRQGIFICTIATTATAQIPGISAAGATPELRKYTAQADVEYLFHERALSLPGIPCNPEGPPSPVLISKAVVDLMQMPMFVIDAGCAVKPQIPAIRLREKGLRCISTGRAFEGGSVLRERTEKLAVEFGKLDRFCVLGESVPGGTTTAQSLLTLLGIDATGKVSSSMVDNAHDIKGRVVAKAHRKAGLKPEDIAANPVGAVEKIGDSMQIVTAVLAAELSRSVPVILAGGTQLLAVACLMAFMEKQGQLTVNWRNIALCTTRWVCCDATADFAGLSRLVKPDLSVFAAGLDFSASRFENLRMYEKGLVKEGVGAGGLACAGFMSGSFSPGKLLREIERLYSRLR